MDRLIKNGDIILDGTATREQKEKQAYKKLEKVEGIMEKHNIESYSELDKACKKRNWKNTSLEYKGNVVRCFAHETLFIFGGDTQNTAYRWCIGWGVVTKIEKGKNIDSVYINFGRKFSKEVYVQDNHSRRQLLLLKRGQYCEVLAKFRYVSDKEKGRKLIMYAQMLQPKYVPKAMDVEHIDLNEYEKMALEEEESKLYYIDELLKGVVKDEE